MTPATAALTPPSHRPGSSPRRSLRAAGLRSGSLRLLPPSSATPPPSTRIPHKDRANHGGTSSPLPPNDHCFQCQPPYCVLVTEDEKAIPMDNGHSKGLDPLAPSEDKLTASNSRLRAIVGKFCGLGEVFGLPIRTLFVLGFSSAIFAQSAYKVSAIPITFHQQQVGRLISPEESGMEPQPLAALNATSGQREVMADEHQRGSREVLFRRQVINQNQVLNLRTDFGAKGDGSTNDTAVLQAAITTAFSEGKSLYIPSGIYIYTPPLDIEGSGLIIYGDGPGNTILQPLSISAAAIQVAQTSDVSGLTFRDLQLRGNSVCTAGILVGINKFDQHYAVGLRFDNCAIENFTATGTGAYCIQRGWWIIINGGYTNNNFNAIRIPNESTVTTLTVTGWARLSNCLNYAIWVGSTASGIGDFESFCARDCDISNNNKGAIYSVAAPGEFLFENCYMEADCKDGVSYLFNAIGSKLDNFHHIRLTVKNCKLSPIKSNKLLNSDYSIVEWRENYGLTPNASSAEVSFNSGTVWAEFYWDKFNSSSDVVDYAQTLAGRIRVDDIDPVSGRRQIFQSDGFNINGHISTIQNGKTRVAGGAALGAGGTVILSPNSNDVAGQIQSNFGTSGWGGGVVAIISFARPYYRIPTVVISPASTKAAEELMTRKVEVTNVSRTGFELYFANAETTPGLAYWNYIVIE